MQNMLSQIMLFEYKICTDIDCFLTRGLNLDFGELKYSANDEYLWRRLAEDIDLSKDFDLNNLFLNNSQLLQ